MLRGVQAKFPQEASTSQLYHLAKGVAPVDKAARQVIYYRALGSGELTRSEGSSEGSSEGRAENSFSEWERTQHSEGSGMLIDDPL